MASDEPATQPTPLSAAELKAHPEYEHVVWPLKPDKSGKAEVGKGRGSPADIYWEIHGKGPTCLVWIMGLGALHTAWQRQTLHFSHAPSHRSKYTSLILDNRGVGKSTVPLGRYSTSVLAADILEILEAISWTGPRQLHIIGVSMGGMIAQELGLMVPDRIASLIIVSSAARLVNTVGFWANLRQRINMFVPKAIDLQLAEVKARLFGPTWIHEPDDDVNYPGGGKFPTNGDRFAAQELEKRSNPDEFSRKGFILQAIAAGWHHKSAVQLKELGDKVGRDRISVMHGKADRMISFPHGEVLAKEVGVELMRWENCGHVLMMEKRIEFNNTIEVFVRRTEAIWKD